jgi:hypothetical protein
VSTTSVTGPVTNSGTLTNPILGLSTTLPAVTSVNGTTIPSSATLLTSTSTTINGSTVPASDTLVGRATTDTLTNKTLTSPTLTNSTQTYSTLTSPKETITISATAATGTVAYDVLTQSILYYTTNASANWTLNFRGNSTTTLNSILAVNSGVTITFINTNGATAYYPNAFQIDGTAVSPKWVGGAAPTSGDANALDAYQFTIFKTAATPTYTVLASAVKYA